MNYTNNPDLELAFKFVQFTGRHIFLTGKAGTGKTTFLLQLKRFSPKRMIVVAPTGVAAINAGGVTIHSFFQLPFHPHIPVQYVGLEGKSPVESPTFKLNREKIDIIKGLDLLVIDEISMVRADLLDAVDLVLRKFRDRTKPFGGIQLLMIGDIQQLAPVVKEEDREILDKYYHTAYFFGSLALKETDFVTIELKHIYRQQDREFIHILNKIRDNQIDPDSLSKLNKRCDPTFSSGIHEGYILLTTHNAQARSVNDMRLKTLPGKEHLFHAEINGEFPEYAYPTENELILKRGAQVMFVKNDLSKDKLYFNGKIGRLIEILDETILIKCDEDQEPIVVQRAEWQNMKYVVNAETKEIDETVIGTFIQYPLKLAWAITIHKSQGLTFERAIIDAHAAFAHGQVYVALSRCRTLEGLVLTAPLDQRNIISDYEVTGFVQQTEKCKPDNELLHASIIAYQQQVLYELFSFTSLDRLLSSLAGIIHQNEKALSETHGNLIHQLKEALHTDLVLISEKFCPQIPFLVSGYSDPSVNTKLQERISKACSYFGDKLQLIQDHLEEIAFETDNKAIQKSLNEALAKLKLEVLVKHTCFVQMKTGFTISDYLQTRAKALLNKPLQAQAKSKPVVDFSGSEVHPVLYNRIRKWRDLKAAETGIPQYMILPQVTMSSLAGLIPQSADQLRLVRGMGKKKSEKYGDEILSIIQKYCTEKNITTSHLKWQLQPEKLKPAKTKTKTDTKKVSFELYRQGRSIEEIAAERKLSVTTIEDHLAHYVGTGDIPVHELVKEEIAELISEELGNMTDRRMTPVKEALGARVSWSEIRFVIKHLEYLDHQNADKN